MDECDNVLKNLLDKLGNKMVTVIRWPLGNGLKITFRGYLERSGDSYLVTDNRSRGLRNALGFGVDDVQHVAAKNTIHLKL